MFESDREELLESTLWEPDNKLLGYIEAGDYYDTGIATLSTFLLILWLRFIV
jgi:hypothetical protein